MKAYAKSCNNINDSYIYVKDIEGSMKKASIKNSGEGEWKEIKIDQIKVINKKCEVGVYTDGKASSWVRVDDFSLVKS